MPDLPETIMQFGSGKFLRGFADLFIHQANQQGQSLGRIVVVQTTGDARANLLTRQGGHYHVVVRGLSGGQRVDRIEESHSISRALVAARQWPDVLAFARSPELRWIISNTAEAGYTLYPEDRPNSAPPQSFPAKLLLVLHERYRAGRPGVHVLPCELFEHNADLLLGHLARLAETWRLPDEFRDWLRRACTWHNTLVDRIVTSQTVDNPRLAGDELYVVAEPYALWAIEVKDGKDGLLEHPAVVLRPDVMPFFLRKVRILNAAHTAMVSRAAPKGIATVFQAMDDPEVSSWLERLLFEEIVPTLRDRVEDAEGFARLTLERFRNPFLAHKVSDILTYHAEKVNIRLAPTRAEFVQKFGRTPPRLEEAIAWSAAAKSDSLR
jgi:tagaturonate reductase